MKYKFFILIFLISSIVAAQGTKDVSLDDCIKIGIQNSKTLMISKSKVLSSQERLNEVNTAELPTLRFNGSYSRLSPVDPFQIGTMQISPSILNNTSFRLTLSQPLFTGNRLSSNSDLSEYNFLASEKDYQKDKNQLTLDIKTAYWNFVKSIELKKTIEKNIVQVKSRLKDMENLFNAGLATNNDLLRLKVQLSNFEILLLDSDNNINVAMLSLNNILGIPLSTNLQPKEKVELNKYDIPNLNELIRKSKQNRSDLKSLDFRIKSNESNIKMIKSGWYPQLSFNANYLFANPNSRIFPSQAKFNGTWDVGVTLTYDIWNWKLTSYQTSQAERTLEQTILSKELTENNIEFEVNQYYKSFLSVSEKLRLTKETVEQAQENYRITAEKFKSGLVLNSDVIDAETSLLSAEINNITAIVDYYIAIARLEKSIENNLK